MTSSEPPRMAENLAARLKPSIILPMPVRVIPRPPKICALSSAKKLATRVHKNFHSAMGPASASACCACVSTPIWYVMDSVQHSTASS